MTLEIPAVAPPSALSPALHPHALATAATARQDARRVLLLATEARERAEHAETLARRVTERARAAEDAAKAVVAKAEGDATNG